MQITFADAPTHRRTPARVVPHGRVMDEVCERPVLGS
jgi:hypothetical protein